MAQPHAVPVLLFDGVCNLCNGFVQFVLRHERDAEPRLHFAALQSAVGAALLERHDLDPSALDTVVLVDPSGAFTESEAALRVLGYLRWPWRWGRVFRILPRGVRDFAYRQIAKRRYRLFGKRESCPMPTPATRARFLDSAD